jgi:hypothetical protein
MEGCDLLEKGVRWRVGDGFSIKTWGDPWLPKTTDFRPVPRAKTSPQPGYLFQLIDNNSGQWKVDFIYALFCEEDGRLICSIPLSDFA